MILVVIRYTEATTLVKTQSQLNHPPSREIETILMLQKPTYEELVKKIQELEQKEAERQRSEDALKESERKYRLLAENIDDIIWTMNAELTHYTYISPSVTRLGYTPEEFMSRPFEAFIVPTYHEHIRNAVLDRLQKEKEGKGENNVGRWELEFLGKNTETIHVESITRPLRDKNGVFQGLLGVTRDITERKKAELKSDQYVRELTALQDLGLIVNSSLSFLEVSSAALRGIMEAIQPDMAYFFLRDGDNLVLQEVLPSEARYTLGEIPEHKVGECICGLTVSKGRLLYSRDIHNDFRCTWDECKKAGIRSFASLPMKNGEEIIGVIGLASFTPRDFEAQAGFLETLAHQISLALANARLYESIQFELAERRKAEETINNSNKLIQTIINTAPTRIFFKDLELRYLGCNNAFAKDAGVECPEDLIGKDDYELVWKKQAELYRTDDCRVIENGIPKLFYDEQQTTPEGNLIWVRTSKVPLRNEANEIIGVLGMYEDITERKRADDTLRLRESYLSAIIENQPGLLWLKDTEGRFLSVNTAFAKSCGLNDPELLVGKTDFDIWPKELADRYTTDDVKVLTSRVPFITEEPISAKGQISWFETFKTPVFDNNGDVIGTTGYAHDITERKKAENALRESEDKFRLTFDSSPDSINVNRVEDGLFVEINEGFTRTTGYNWSDVMGKTSMELNIWENPTDRQKLVQGLQEKGFVENLETQFRRKDGNLLNGLMSARVIKLKGVPHLISITRDITERKIHEKEQMKIEKLESLGILAGGIAHDFNNILTGIMGNISFAKVYLDTAHKSYKPLAEAEKATKRAGELAHQLLTFARGGEPNKKVVSPRNLMHEALTFILHGSNVKGTIDIPDSIHAIEADEGQISQIFQNIIINATQAMPGGGILTVIAKNEELYNNNSLSLPPGPYIRLTFTDQGRGISDENLKKIFDPYFTTKSTGIGLGLSSVHSIVNRHGGHIGVSSTVGKGTTFTIHLPSLGKAYTKYQADFTGQASGEHKGGSILVMDDDDMIRDVASSMLTYLGYQVTLCASGEEALELYRKSMESDAPFTLVIMDLTIPGGLGGKEAAEQILSLYPQARLAVSSGYSNDPIMSNYKEYGFRGAIAKPYSIHEFEKVLGSLLAH